VPLSILAQGVHDDACLFRVSEEVEEMGSTPPFSVTQGTMHEDVSNRSKAGLTATYAKCNAQSKARCVRPKERAYPIACPIMHSKGPKPERGPDDGQAEI
jgi:hypothetical protein